jgi:Spo12 family
VGLNSAQSTFESSFSAHPSRQILKQRLLVTPDTLTTTAPHGTTFLVIDQEVAFFDEEAVMATMDASADDVMEVQMHPTRIVRSLIVAKRRQDGLVASMSEEEDHKKATAPLATRAAAVSNSFYSPSDSVVSPCTSKLNLAKKKHHMK